MPHVSNVRIERYFAHLKDKYRSPSRGGNTRAWHQHGVVIDGQVYSWLGLGARKWVFASDTVSFDWEFDATNKYRNVKSESIQVIDRLGNEVVRGERGFKKWRTARQRAPTSGRERDDN